MGGCTSGPSAQSLHPSLLQPHPCSIEGERGTEASEAASRMMQSTAKVFISEGTAARFGFLPSFCNGDGVGRGVFFFCRETDFQHTHLSGNDCGCLLVCKGSESLSLLRLEASEMLL